VVRRGEIVVVKGQEVITIPCIVSSKRKEKEKKYKY